MDFRLSLTSWSLPACSLAEAAGIAKVFGVGALDDILTETIHLRDLVRAWEGA